MRTRRNRSLLCRNTVLMLAALSVLGWVAPVAPAAAEVPAHQQLSDTFAAVASKASGAVVFITVEKEVSRRAMPYSGPESYGVPDLRDFFDRFFGPGFRQNQRRMPVPRGRAPRGRGGAPRGGPPLLRGQGSGFIISPDGYIVTNNHVVGEADRVQVQLADGRELEAKTIGSDPQTEIALIKIDAADLPTLPMGDVQDLDVGEWVLAIGNPFGLTHTVTAGIVSATGRGEVGIVDYADFIQTDAAINPGNSGGPLLDLDGNVVGMNTAIYSRSGGSMGIGFAVPVNMIAFVEKQLRETGEIKRGFLGVLIQPVTADNAEFFDLENARGVLIASVEDASPADNAGLKRGDVVVAFEGQPVEEPGSFRSRIASTAPGKTVTLTVNRDGKRIKKDVTLGTRSGKLAAGAGGASKPEMELGLSVQNLTQALAEEMGYEGEEGVLVSAVAPGSSAAAAGIQPGALITEVNRQPVRSVNQFTQAVKQTEKDMVLLLVREGNRTRYVTLQKG